MLIPQNVPNRFWRGVADHSVEGNVSPNILATIWLDIFLAKEKNESEREYCAARFNARWVDTRTAREDAYRSIKCKHMV